MATATPKTRRLRLGPRSAGLLLTPAEFDRARFQKGWRYELINGVFVVAPTPSRQERGPNQTLGRWLENYQESHPQGSALDATLPEEEIQTGQNRRRLDRAIWAGPGRDPEEDEIPTIAVEFVSKGKVNQQRDYAAKRAEYREIGVREYWVINRFRRILSVYRFTAEKDEELRIPEEQTYETPLLPGFVLALRPLLSAGRPVGEEATEVEDSRGSSHAGAIRPVPERIVKVASFFDELRFGYNHCRCKHGEVFAMTTTIWGIVKEGRIVPSSPLPEGAHVEIRLADPSIEGQEELREEFAAWDRASEDALDLIERVAQEGEADAAR